MKELRKIKVGVVGVGHLGRVHARIYRELTGVELVGVVDTSRPRAEEIGALYGVPAYDDLERFLDEREPEALSVVVPTTAHFEVARWLAGRGIHLLVEKPVTATVEEACSLKEVASGKGIVLQVGHVERFNDAVRYICEHTTEPLCVQTRRQGPFSPRAADVSVVLDLMIHDIDIVLSLARSEVRGINAVGRRIRTAHEELAFAQITFQSGLVADLQASRVAERRLRQIDVTTADRYYSVDCARGDVAVYRTAGAPGGSAELIERPMLPHAEPLKQELAHFVDCVRGRHQPLVGINDGIRALAVAAEIQRQIREQ